MAMRLPGRIRKLPGCGSAWNRPSSSIIFQTARAPRRAMTRRSRPARSMASICLAGMPLTNSCTLRSAQVHAHAVGAARLDAEVQLAQQRQLELLDDLGRLIAAQLRRLRVGDLGQ